MYDEFIDFSFYTLGPWVLTSLLLLMCVADVLVLCMTSYVRYKDRKTNNQSLVSYIIEVIMYMVASAIVIFMCSFTFSYMKSLAEFTTPVFYYSFSVLCVFLATMCLMWICNIIKCMRNFN